MQMRGGVENGGGLAGSPLRCTVEAIARLRVGSALSGGRHSFGVISIDFERPALVDLSARPKGV